MDERDSPPSSAKGRAYRSLPPALRLDETIASVDPGPVPDPTAGRSVDQHQALRDD
jgi:hypothetical protein